jgi:hypothetical protein
MTHHTQDSSNRPRFVVCEDGQEYLERFERFLGADFEFAPARDFSTLLAQLERLGSISGILLDLDFRRTDRAGLVDEHGQTAALVGQEALTQYVTNQGLFILAGLRERGYTHRVLLFADIEDAQQSAYLMRTFAPLDVVPSHVGLRELKLRLAELGK